MTEEEEARDDRRSVRDTILQVITATATPIVGAIATNTGNPRNGQIVMTWIALAAFSVAAIVALSFLKSIRAERYVTQAQHQEVLDLLKQLREEQQQELSAQQHTMRHMLIASANEYTKRRPLHEGDQRGWITPEEHRAWSEMYGAYERLGLNGYMRTFVEKVDELPTYTAEEVAKAREGL